MRGARGPRRGQRRPSGARPTTPDDLLDDHVLDRAVVAGVGLRRGDGVDDAPAGLVGNLAEDGVRAGEPGGRPDGDEELGAVGARSAVGHGQQVGPGERQVRVELVCELVPGAAGAVPQAVTALDHEAPDDPVEDRTVVQRLRARLSRVGIDTASSDTTCAPAHTSPAPADDQTHPMGTRVVRLDAMLAGHAHTRDNDHQVTFSERSDPRHRSLPTAR